MAETLEAVRGCAHRGDSTRFRENTIPAIRSALANGAEFVEIDIRLTADGEVIVLHDRSALRLWGEPRMVSELSLAQVQQLGDGENRIPSLREVLSLFVGSPSTLLIDMEEPHLGRAAQPVVAASGVRVSWCGDTGALRAVRQLDAEASIWMAWNEATIPTAEDLAELDPEYVNSDYLYLTRELVEGVHRLGRKLSVWTIDHAPTMRWALELGVDSVTSNQLDDLQKVVDDGLLPRVSGDQTELDLDEVMSVARELGEWAISFARSADPGHIESKFDPADLVTEVDVAVERHVRAVVGDRFPQFDFVGEEMGGAARAGVPCWYLDPVDGTANFANRIPWNAFSLALVVDGTPLVAVVADPWRGELFEACKDGGAKLNGTPLSISGPTSDGDPLSGRIVSTELDNQTPWPGMLQFLDGLGKRFSTMRIMGSGTMTVMGIAANRGVGAVIGNFGAVDHLAAVLIVKEAGGVVLNSDGEACLFPSSGGILAAAPHAAPALYALWQESVAAEAATH